MLTGLVSRLAAQRRIMHVLDRPSGQNQMMDFCVITADATRR
jgi:hypothetical protein